MDSTVADEVLEELLVDLKHDLGKHLVLPLSLLPRDACGSLVHSTALRALTHTRHGALSALSARELWQRFQDELPPEHRHDTRYLELAQALRRVLTWEHTLSQATEPYLSEDQRTTLMGDFREVGACISRWLQQVQRT